MSDQQAAPPAQEAPLHGATGGSAKKLHDTFLTAEKALESGATLLSQAGADPQAIKAVSQMADVCRKLLSGMAQLAQKEQPPADPAAAPADAAPAQPHTMDSATNSMQQDLAAKRG